MATKIPVFYIVATRDGQDTELGKFFERQHAVEHLESIKTRGGPWSSLRLEERSEWPHEQHPAHQAAEGRKAAWEKP